MFGLTSLKASDTITDIRSGSGSITVDQLVGTFSSDPSLIAFAQLYCDPSWYNDVLASMFCLIMFLLFHSTFLSNQILFNDVEIDSYV